jgi:hypothetical protein
MEDQTKGTNGDKMDTDDKSTKRETKKVAIMV